MKERVFFRNAIHLKRKRTNQYRTLNIPIQFNPIKNGIYSYMSILSEFQIEHQDECRVSQLVRIVGDNINSKTLENF